MKKPESFDISMKEFDNMNGKHVFSKRYKKKKKEMIKNYRKSLAVAARTHYLKVAAGIAAALVACPVIANAATDGELFSRIWGTTGKSDIESHEEVVYEEEKDTSYAVTYPERDYEDVEPEKAEELIGMQMTYPSITKEIDGTTITILSAVRDKNAAVVEFTMEKEGGVDVLNYSQLDNEAKGAWFSDNSTFWFQIGDTGNIYVDLDKSTEDKLYCYNYIVTGFAAPNITMNVDEYPCTIGERQASVSDEARFAEIEAETVKSTVQIPVSETVSSLEFVNVAGGTLQVSPLSIQIDRENAGLGLMGDKMYDSWNYYYVCIHYKDGTDYIVKEHSLNGMHTCDVDIDNTSYGSGKGKDLIYVFNRLVDIDQVESVTVNDMEYSLK